MPVTVLEAHQLIFPASTEFLPRKGFSVGALEQGFPRGITADIQELSVYLRIHSVGWELRLSKTLEVSIKPVTATWQTGPI